MTTLYGNVLPQFISDQNREKDSVPGAPSTQDTLRLAQCAASSLPSAGISSWYRRVDAPNRASPFVCTSRGTCCSFENSLRWK